MDIVFVISSKVVDQDKNFEIMKEIVKGMIEKFGLFCVRYSLIIFGEIFDVKIRFDNVFDYEIEIVKLVDIVEKELGDVMLYKVLEEVCYLFVVVEDI